MILSSRSDATRDVQFDPLHSHILASVYENGSLALWDLRNVRGVQSGSNLYSTSSSDASVGNAGQGEGISQPWLKVRS